MRMRCTGSSGPWADGRPAPQVPYSTVRLPRCVRDQRDSSQPILPSTSSTTCPTGRSPSTTQSAGIAAAAPGLQVGRRHSQVVRARRVRVAAQPGLDHRQRHVEPDHGQRHRERRADAVQVALAAHGPRQHERPDADLQVVGPHRRQVGVADPRILVLVPVHGRREPAQPVEVDRGDGDAEAIQSIGELDRGGRLAGAVHARQQDGARVRRARHRAPLAAGPAGILGARPGASFAGEHARGLERRRALLVGLELPAVVARGVGVPVEQVAQLRASRSSWRVSTAAQPLGRRPHGHQREQVVEAQGRAGDGVGPCRVRGQADEALRAARVRPRVALAGRARGRSRGVGDPAGPAPALGGIRHLELAEAGHERRAEQDRGTQRARPPPVRLEDRRDVPRAEPARGVERLAERDVVDALGQDRLEVGVLGSLALPAQRAAGRAERVGEVHVRARADGQPGSLGAAHRAIVRVDDGTGWVWDLPVMSVDAPAANNRPQP